MTTRRIVIVSAFVAASLVGAFTLERVSLAIGRASASPPALSELRVARATVRDVIAAPLIVAVEAAGSAAPASAVVVVVPDPTVDPLGDASAVVKLWKSGAIIPALIVAAFVILSLLAKYVSWLSEGKRAAYVAAGIGLLAELIPAAAQGQTPTLPAIVAAIGAAVLLILHPTPKAGA